MTATTTSLTRAHGFSGKSGSRSHATVSLDLDQAKASATEYGARLSAFVQALKVLADIQFGLPEQRTAF